jgi:hypothetical protein
MVVAGSDRAAVLAPGGGYSTDGPLLMYAGLAVERRGGHAHRIAWTQPLPELDAEVRAWVASQVAAAIDETAATTGAAAPIVIGKSLGSLAAPLVAERGLAAVWFTPLLTDGPTLAALRRTTAPCLLVVMTLFPSSIAGPRLLRGDVVRSDVETLARNHRPGAAQALSRDAALQWVRGVGVRRSLAAPLRVAVGVIHHDQHEGECDDRDDDDGDEVGCSSCHVGAPFEATISVW